MSDLNDFMRGIDDAAERRKAEEAKWMALLGPPDLEENETGYWRVAGGVMRCRKEANSYNKRDVEFVAKDEVERLWRVIQLPARRV